MKKINIFGRDYNFALLFVTVFFISAALSFIIFEKSTIDIEDDSDVFGVTVTDPIAVSKDTFVAIEHPDADLSSYQRAYSLRAKVDDNVGTTPINDIVNGETDQSPNDFNRHMVAYYGFDLSGLGADSSTHEITKVTLTMYSPHLISPPASTPSEFVPINAFRTQYLRVVPDTGWNESDNPLTYNEAIYRYVKGGETGSNQTPVPLTYNESGFEYSVLFHEEYPVVQSFVASTAANIGSAVICPYFAPSDPCIYDERGVSITNPNGYYELVFTFNAENGNIDEFKNLLGEQFVLAFENGRQASNYGYGFYTKEAAGIPDPTIVVEYEDREPAPAPTSGTSLLNSFPTQLENDPTDADYVHINNPFEQQQGHDWRDDGNGDFPKYQSPTYIPFEGYERLHIGDYISSVNVNNNGTPSDYSDDEVSYVFDFVGGPEPFKDRLVWSKARDVKFGVRFRYMVADSADFLAHFPNDLEDDPCFVDQLTNLPEWEPLGKPECANRENLHTLTDQFVDAMLAFVDTDPDVHFEDIAFIDMVVFGSYGEGSGSDINAGNYEEYNPYLDAYLTKDLHGIQLLMMTDPHVPLAYAVYEYGVLNPGSENIPGIRRDSMGSAHSHFSFSMLREHQSVSVTNNLWKTEPFVAELYGTASGTSGNKLYHMYRHSMLEAKSMHVSAIQRLRFQAPGANDDGNPINDADIEKELDILLASAGSKYAVNNFRMVQCSDGAASNREVEIYTQLSNYGNVPVYYDWSANLILVDALDNRYEFPLSSVQLRSILPTLDPVTGDNFPETLFQELTLSGVPSGTYSVKISFYNERYDTNYQLFIVDQDPGNDDSTVGFPSEDGEYLLGTAVLDFSENCGVVEPPVNDPPQVDAGANISVFDDNLAELDTVTDAEVVDIDTPSNQLSYLWEAVSPQNGSVSLATPTAINTLISDATVGIHTLTLEVNDGDNSVSDSMQLTVIENMAPSIGVLGVSHIESLAYNSINIQPNVLDSTYPGASVIEYEWDVVSGNAAYLVNDLSPEVRLNFTVQGAITIRLTVSDGYKNSTRDYTVTAAGSTICVMEVYSSNTTCLDNVNVNSGPPDTDGDNQQYEPLDPLPQTQTGGNTSTGGGTQYNPQTSNNSGSGNGTTGNTGNNQPDRVMGNENIIPIVSVDEESPENDEDENEQEGGQEDDTPSPSTVGDQQGDNSKTGGVFASIGKFISESLSGENLFGLIIIIVVGITIISSIIFFLVKAFKSDDN